MCVSQNLIRITTAQIQLQTEGIWLEKATVWMRNSYFYLILIVYCLVYLTLKRCSQLVHGTANDG